VASVFSAKDIGLIGIYSEDMVMGGGVEGALKQDVSCQVQEKSRSRLLTLLM